MEETSEISGIYFRAICACYIYCGLYLTV